MRSWSGTALIHVNIASEFQELIADSPGFSWKNLMNTLLHQTTSCKFNWCGNYLRPVATKTLWQPWLHFPFIFSLPDIRSRRQNSCKSFNYSHAYLPTTLISDRGSAFESQVIKDVASFFSITLKHVTTKPTRTNGFLQQSHAQSNKRWRSKQSNEDHCAIYTSVLRSLVMILLITQALAVSQAEFIIDAFLTIDWVQSWEFAHNKHPFPLHKLPNMFLTKRRRSTEMLAEVPCKFRSDIKFITTKRPTLQISKERILYVSYNRKLIIYGAKIF